MRNLEIAGIAWRPNAMRLECHCLKPALLGKFLSAANKKSLFAAHDMSASSDDQGKGRKAQPGAPFLRFSPYKRRDGWTDFHSVLLLCLRTFKYSCFYAMLAPLPVDMFQYPPS